MSGKGKPPKGKTNVVKAAKAAAKKKAYPPGQAVPPTGTGGPGGMPFGKKGKK